MAITDVLNLTPEVVAEQNPELHEMRKIAFGEDYLSDIAQGTGTAQYYTGWGNVPTVNFTPPVEEIAPVETDIVSAVPMITEPAGDAGIIAAGVPTPVAPPFIETEPNILTPPTLPGGAPISGPHGDYVITDPVTGDTYAPGDYTDVAGTLADPREKIDTLADTGGRDLPDVRQYADRSFGVDYEALDQEGQAEVDQAYGDPTIMDAPDITPLEIATGVGDFEVSGDIAPGGVDQVLGPVVTTPSYSEIIGASRGNGRDEPSAPPSRPGGAPASGPHGNGGGGDSGGKIVCTMMNDSYGFGSFRNKIWLRQSKTLPMEYQLGYHALFLPLVKFSKRKGLINKAVKKVLEHIAVHRTIDIRQEARGKRHMLGRVYRKILEPICYWVGKHGKRT